MKSAVKDGKGFLNFIIQILEDQALLSHIDLMETKNEVGYTFFFFFSRSSKFGSSKTAVVAWVLALRSFKIIDMQNLFSDFFPFSKLFI